MRSLLFVFLFLFSTSLCAQLSVAECFSDNMVLQRSQPIKIWGSAAAGSEVEIQFMEKVYKTRADENGGWEAILQPQAVDPIPRQLKVRSSGQEVLLENILIGDVWLLIGQSNMEWPMSGEMFYQEELKNANNEQLRFYNPHFIGKNLYGQKHSPQDLEKLKRGEFYVGNWEKSDTASFRSMSAVGYYFGQRINKETAVPIGLINLSIGGAPIETFISEETLKSSRFSSKTKGNWLFNEDLPVWVRERG